MIRAGETATIRMAAILTIAAIAVGCSTTPASTSTGNTASEDANYMAKAEADERETLVCRREQPTGSRISERVCLTAEDWKKIEQRSQEMLDRSTRKAQQHND
jgi:hypothetical protein